MVEPLTEREQEILACLGEHLSNDEIAHKLHLAEKTVRWYNTQIYGKLGVSSRKEAVAQARQLGLVPGRPVSQKKHNLPAPVTPFAGRRHELAKLTSLLGDPDTRLITILAPGGMGKTRLALEVAHAMAGEYAHGVFFVPLAPLVETTDVVFAIADQVGLPFHGAEAPPQQLLTFLHGRSVLLVLDNFEHLLPAAPTVSEILRAAPGVRVLATSRERLRLQGETVYILHGLDFQTWENTAELEKSAAAELFLKSARRVRGDFKLAAGDLEHLAHICHLTGGMPLALELAAGWTSTLSLQHIADELKQGLDILQTELCDVPDRHRSMRAAFDLTWQRLGAAERQVFMRLSVFRGGFSREAAAIVAAAEQNQLRGFSSKALIEFVAGERYDIHELLRKFGADKLAQSGQEAAARTEHAAYFAGFMVHCWGDMRTHRQLEAVERIAADFDNVRAAWMSALERQAWEEFSKFLDPLRVYCEVRTRGQVGIELFQHAEQVLRSTPATVETELALGRVQARLAWFYFQIGLSEKGAVLSDAAILVLRQHDCPEDLLAALDSRHCAALALGHIDVDAPFAQEGLRLARARGDTYWESNFLTGLAINELDRYDLDSARLHIEEALAVHERVGDRFGSILCYGLLGRIEESQGNYAQAASVLQQAIALARTFGYHLNSGADSTHLARIAFHDGNVAAARRHICEALRTNLDSGHLWYSTFPLVTAAQMMAAENKQLQAVEILGAIDKHLTPFHRADHLAWALRDDLASSIPAQDFASAWARGQERELSDLIQEVLLEFAGSADTRDLSVLTRENG